MMNRLSVIACVLSAVALGISAFFILRKEGIVYVDSIKLIANYNGSKALKAEFDKKAAQWRSNLDTLATELESEIGRYQKVAKTLNATQRQQAEKKIEQLKKQYDEYDRVVSENARREDQRITGQVVEEVTAFLKKYGRERGYRFIMGATSIGNIVYADESTDITDEVLVQLNASRKL